MLALLASSHYTNTTLLNTEHWRTCTPNGRWCRVRPCIPVLRLGKYYLPALVEEIEVDGVTYSIYEEVTGDRLSTTDLNMMLELYLIVEDLFKAGWIHGDIREENVIPILVWVSSSYHSTLPRVLAIHNGVMVCYTIHHRPLPSQKV